MPALYTNYVARLTDALQPILAIGGSGGEAAAAEARRHLPPMPTDATTEELRAWYLEWMRAQHASITDALSGERLDALEGCVQIAVQGTDTAGAPLRLGDAKGLAAWLCGLEGSCTLLTAGPAAGKTWLMSQLIMHTLATRVPILVKVEQMQTRLAEIKAADDWVDAYLALTLDARHYEFLREEMTTGRALLLLDGLDEAGAHRARIERHVAEVVARRGCTLLCTSRPAGLTEGIFDDFHQLQLAPLSDAQQAAFLAQRLERLGAALATELELYVRNMPVEADTRRRVTANPLMLSMVASIAALRQGVDMPRTTAELYEVAASAMLQRGTVSDAAVALLQATFFEAHADQQRVVTEEHLHAAARHLDAAARQGSAAVDELRDLVVRDRLPLVRLLQEEPLQMQAFHLSFQEYYAMRAVSEGGVRLPGFRWDVWWTNAVFMGVQTGDAFGEHFVEAAGLEAPWRRGVVTALAREALPAAWLPTVAEAAGGDVARLKTYVGRYRDVLLTCSSGRAEKRWRSSRRSSRTTRSSGRCKSVPSSASSRGTTSRSTPTSASPPLSTRAAWERSPSRRRTSWAARGGTSTCTTRRPRSCWERWKRARPSKASRCTTTELWRGARMAPSRCGVSTASKSNLALCSS